MAFVTLHLKTDGEEIVVNSNKIEFMFSEGGGTKIILPSEAFVVDEQLFTVFELIESASSK